MKQHNYKKILKYSLLILVLAYTVFKSFDMGADSNVYLHASKQIFRGENIYEKGIYNYYLYSPLFAILLRPLSVFDLSVGRIIWGLINLVLTFRLWIILSNLFDDNLRLGKKMKNTWMIGVIIISAGFLNHNLILGQITIVILWLTFEGLYQIIIRERNVSGALLLALGVNIKLIPMLGLYYLFFKGKFKALAFCSLFIILSVFLPSLIIGHDYNTYLLENWWKSINPTEDGKYVFEDDDGTHSLNALLPAYFYDFSDGKAKPDAPKRLIASVPHETLVIIMQATRILFVLSILLLIYYSRNSRKIQSLYFLWEFSYLALVTVLIFPHQQKYAMLYYVPAGSYLLLFALLTRESQFNSNIRQKTIAIASICMMFISSFSARDIVGVTISDFFDNYHWFGLVNIVFMVFLYIIKPEHLIELRTNSKEVY
jgi:hypothetical protein